MVISRESAHILVDSRYFVEVEARAQGYQLHLLDATNTLTTIVNQIIADEQLQTLGFEGQQVSWETAHRWKSELNAKLVSATPDVLRQIKTPEEVEIIRLACGIADRGAEHIRRFIQAGMSEREIAAELEWFMRQQGAEKASFDTIVASGWRGALPHGKASDKIVAAGEFVTLDFGALYQGYCSDMTRTLLVNGEGVSAESHPLFNVYQIVLQAQLAAISAIRPGVRCQQVDDAARQVITEAGFSHYFGHNTGHAIGIEVHEDPRFSPRDTTTLQPGMLLTVEPGIYLPGHLRQQGHAFFRIDFAFFRLLQLDNTLEQLGLNKGYHSLRTRILIVCCAFGQHAGRFCCRTDSTIAALNLLSIAMDSGFADDVPPLTQQGLQLVIPAEAGFSQRPFKPAAHVFRQLFYCAASGHYSLQYFSGRAIPGPHSTVYSTRSTPRRVRSANQSPEGFFSSSTILRSAR